MARHAARTGASAKVMSGRIPRVLLLNSRALSMSRCCVAHVPGSLLLLNELLLVMVVTISRVHVEVLRSHLLELGEAVHVRRVRRVEMDLLSVGNHGMKVPLGHSHAGMLHLR